MCRGLFRHLLGRNSPKLWKFPPPISEVRKMMVFWLLSHVHNTSEEIQKLATYTAKSFQLSPGPPDQGLCPCTPLGAQPPDPSRPNLGVWIKPCEMGSVPGVVYTRCTQFGVPSLSSSGSRTDDVQRMISSLVFVDALHSGGWTTGRACSLSETCANYRQKFSSTAPGQTWTDSGKEGRFSGTEIIGKNSMFYCVHITVWPTDVRTDSIKFQHRH